MGERKKIENGCLITLRDADSLGELNFTVNRHIGEGGNAVAYEVIQGENEIGRLKEFFPLDMEHLCRKEDGLTLETEGLPEEEAKRFVQRQKEFEELLEKRKELRNLSLDIGNTMPEFCQLLYGNNTSYLFQSYRHGLCYHHVTGETLEEIVKTAIGLTEVLRCYHDCNYVHLDVKPENMLVYKESTGVSGVQLFDIDTVTNMDDLHQGRIDYAIPFTKNYAAYELEHNRPGFPRPCPFYFLRLGNVMISAS